MIILQVIIINFSEVSINIVFYNAFNINSNVFFNFLLLFNFIKFYAESIDKYIYNIIPNTINNTNTNNTNISNVIRINFSIKCTTTTTTTTITTPQQLLPSLPLRLPHLPVT